MGTSVRRLTAGWILSVAAWTGAEAADILFDASKREMAANADWVADADAWNLTLPAYPCSGTSSEANPARFPTPAQAAITATTPETFWTGALSAWAIDLVKAGHTVETLAPGGSITWGDPGNPQDLGHYQLFVVVEPQNPFTAPEKAAILAFVDAGGGLFLVADHETSDRDCDGWDSPHVWNDLTGATSGASAGAFGIWFRVDGSDARPSEDWFDDPVDDNVSGDPGDPILHGPFGSGAGGLGLFGSTSMDIQPADNPTVTAHVWRTGQPQGNQRVTFATASYGSGRVAAIGDSSPADDGTGDAGDSLHPGWDKATGAVSNREIHLNACAWLLSPPPDTTPPSITAGPAALAGDCTATIAWSTDEPATSSVDFGATPAYGSSAAAGGLSRSHEVSLDGLAPGAAYHYRVSSVDAAGNGPAVSADALFSTAAAAAPTLASGPQADAVTGSSASLTWTTDEPATSTVEYGTTPAYGNTATVAGYATQHAVPVTGLSPLTAYHYRVLSTDTCGNGPTASTDRSFSTGPASADLSGWRLEQQGSSQSFTFPAGTTIPAGGYLVVARDANRAEFEQSFPSFPAGAVFLDSNAAGSCANGCLPQVNGGETFELYDASSVKRDGPTISMSQNNAYQRNHPGDPAGSGASWTVVGEAAANPGQGAGPGSGAGIVINEMADAPDYTKEFVELYYDPAQPDTSAPAAVADLRATPLSATSIRLEWTATGDDGSSGTAASYDLRRSARRILTEADFAAATQVAGEPLPRPTGSPEQFTVGGLAADTAHYFALRVADEAPNASPPSNEASAVTAPAGSSAPAAHLVVSQLRVSGTTDDVIELYNPTGSAVSLAGHSLQYLAANGNFGFRVNLDPAASVASQGWYLTAANGYAGSPARDGSLGTNNLSSTAGHALLVSKTTNVTGCADPAIVDKVGYGATAVCPEGGAGRHVPTPGAGQSVERRPGGSSGSGQDSDLNDVDFLGAATPALHGVAASPASPPPFLGNVRDTLYLARVAGGAELHWASAAGATAYRVYRGVEPGFLAALPAPWMTVPESLVVDGDVPATIFYYVVRATDGSLESSE